MNCKLAVFISLLFLARMTGLAQSPAFLDSLKSAVKEATHPYQKAKLLNQLAVSYMHHDVRVGIDYGKQAFELMPDTFPMEKGYILNTIGNLYCNSPDAEKALAFFDSAVVYSKKAENPRGVAMTYGNISTYHLLQDDYEQALSYLYKSLKINEELKDGKGMGHNLVAIVSINHLQKEYEEGIRNAKKAFHLFPDKDFEAKGVALYNVGVMFQEFVKLDSALYYFEKAAIFFEKAKIVENIAMIQESISGIYYRRKNYPQALEHIEKAQELYDQVVNIEIKMKINVLLGEINLDLHNYKKSVQYFQLAYDQAALAGMKRYTKLAVDGLAKNYAAQGNYQLAYQYSQELLTLKDSILDESKLEQLQELQVQYDTYKKEQANKLLAKERDIATLEARRNELFTYTLLGLLALAGIIGFLLFRQYRARARTRQLALKHRLLRNQMNPHFIFNSLTAIQSFIYKSQPREAGKFLSSFAKLVRAILDNSREEYITLEKEIQWLENYLKLQLLRFENGFEYEIEVGEELDLLMTKIPPMLTQPFIENALEHGFKNIDYKGILVLSFKEVDHQLQIEVKDNGVGLSAAATQQNKEHKSLATIITKERLQFLNRKSSSKINFTIEEVLPHGTKVSFSLPLEVVGSK